MGILINNNIEKLWEESVQEAEHRCSISLEEPLEKYLVSLLIDYTDKPDMSKTQFALAFLEAQHQQSWLQKKALQKIGDECLLYAGLFPQQAEKRHVKISYFVDMGRTAYSAISHLTNDVFSHLALRFVLVMDVLQSLHPDNKLMPLEAYEQWKEVGSQRALTILSDYTHVMSLHKRRLL